MSDTVAESAASSEPVEVDESVANNFRWVHFGRILAYWVDTWIVLGIPAKLIAVYRYDDIVRFGVWNTVAGLVIGVAYFTFVPRVLAGCTFGLFCVGASS